MGTVIEGKTQRVAQLTDGVPLSPDGWSTVADIIGAGALPTFNVTAYGALGDGTTNDAPAIQLAINACAGAGGGIVYLPPGQYLLGAGLRIVASGVRLVGAGIAATALVVAAASNFDAVTITAPSGNAAILGTYLVGCGVEHLSIRRASPTTLTNIGLKLTYVMFSYIDDVYIYNWGVGFYISAGNTNYVNRVKITGALNNLAVTMYGFYITSVIGPQDTLRMIQCDFEYDFPQAVSNTAGTVNAGVGNVTGWFLGGGAGIQDIMIVESGANNCKTPLQIVGTGATGAADFDVHFYNWASGDSTGASTITNVLQTASGGIDFCGGICSAQVGFQISGSSGIVFRGMQFYNTGTAIAFASNCVNCVVTNCVSYGSTTAFVSISASSYISVANNSIIGAGTGVTFDATSSNCQVTGNTMNGITTPVTIASGATNIVVRNNPGVQDGLAVVTTPSVTSGVAFTPSVVADTNVYLTYSSAGTVTSVTMGPSTGAENTVYGGDTVAAGGFSHSLRCPVGWKVVVTTVTSTIAATVVTC